MTMPRRRVILLIVYLITIGILLANRRVSPLRLKYQYPTPNTTPDHLNHTTANQSCRRKCLHHGSKIYYSEYTDGGLDDRIYVITTMANLAAFLCADLVLKPPSELLQPYHNDNQKLSSDLEWSDFLNATDTYDSSPVLHSASKEFGKALWENQPPCFNNKIFNEECTAFDTGSESKYAGWLHVVSNNWYNAFDDFKKVYNNSFARDWDTSSVGFVWEIHMSWWSTRLKADTLRKISPPTRGDAEQFDRTKYLEMLPNFQSNWPRIDTGKGCSYVQVDYSASIKIMQKSFITEVRKNVLEDASIGLLHLRRADATHICDTSVTKLKEYLSCSLGGIVGLQPNITLVITSDEKDSGYRNEVIGLGDDFGYMTIIDGDHIAQRVVAEALESGLIPKAMGNNFVIFAVENVLRDPGVDKSDQLIDFRFTRRRDHCHDCEPAQVL